MSDLLTISVNIGSAVSRLFSAKTSEQGQGHMILTVSEVLVFVTHLALWEGIQGIDCPSAFAAV